MHAHALHHMHACRLDDTCFTGFNYLVSAFLFTVETQQTIGERRRCTSGVRTCMLNGLAAGVNAGPRYVRVLS